jgi:hypothetical protein
MHGSPPADQRSGSSRACDVPRELPVAQIAMSVWSSMVQRIAIEAKAHRLERVADAINATLPAKIRHEPAVSRADALELSPDDPRWGRRAVEDLRARAHRLREVV